MTESHSRSQRLLENRVAALDYENKDLLEKKHRSEAQVQRLHEQIRAGQDEVTRLVMC